MARERLVSVRLTPEDLAALDRLRAPTGLSRSGYLRHLLRRQAETPDGAPWAAVLAKLDQVLAAVQAREPAPDPAAPPAVAPEAAAALRASVAALAGDW